jgi:hypothetical protein
VASYRAAAANRTASVSSFLGHSAAGSAAGAVAPHIVPFDPPTGREYMLTVSAPLAAMLIDTTVTRGTLLWPDAYPDSVAAQWPYAVAVCCRG